MLKVDLVILNVTDKTSRMHRIFIVKAVLLFHPFTPEFLKQTNPPMNFSSKFVHYIVRIFNRMANSVDSDEMARNSYLYRPTSITKTRLYSFDPL